jgi:hypothetical protein
MRAWVLLPFFVASLFAEPPRFNVKIVIDATRATPAMHALSLYALQHGLYDDSLIVNGPSATAADIAADSGRGQFTRTLLLRGRISAKGDSAAVCLALYNVLLQAVDSPDSFTVAIADFRNGLTAAGRRIARRIADKNPQHGTGGKPCF